MNVRKRSSAPSEFEIIILAGGSSKRFPGIFKPLLELGGKPLIGWILDNLSDLSKRMTIVVHDHLQRDLISSRVMEARILVDEYRISAPMIGALTGARAARAPMIFLMAADQPFLGAEVVLKLVDGCREFDACAPRWPNGYLEPLAAAYRRDALIRAAQRALRKCDLSFNSILSILKTKFMDVHDLHPNPEFAFHNINSLKDYLRADKLLRSRVEV